MKNLARTTLLATVLICACSTVSKREIPEVFPPPPLGFDVKTGGEATERAQDLDQALRENPSLAAKVLVRYLQAKLLASVDPAKSCDLWIDVASTPKFPLAAVARLRAVETCAVSRPEATAYAKTLTDTNEPWLRETSLRAALARAVRGGDRASEMRLSIDVAKYETAQAAQLKLIERSLALARELADASTEGRASEIAMKIAPRRITAPQPDQYMLVAADFRRVRDFGKAREYYSRVLDGGEFSDFEKFKALDGIRMTYKLENQREKFLAATRDYSEFARAHFFPRPKKQPAPLLSKYVESRITLARAVWTENSAREAQTILQELEREIKGRHPAEESLFLRARIEEEAGHLDKTVQILEGIDDRRIADRSLKSRVLWYRAWNFRKVKRYAEAAELLQRLIDQEESQPAIAKDHFWLGRVLKESGDHEKGKAEFRWLTENDPIGYYGLLAYRELGERIPPLDSERAPSHGALDQTTPPLTDAITARALFADERLIFDWLIAADEADLGRRYLDQVPVARRSQFDEGQTIDYLKQYARAGAYQSLFGRLSEMAPDAKKQLLFKQPELVFPRPWLPVVENSSRKYGVKPELVYSIMRQESSFNPTSRSGADAFGLMQLIPEVAEPAARTANIPLKNHEDLYRPETNIPLGTITLRNVLSKWNGIFIPAVASYNASEKAVAGWLRTRDRQDPLQFIEDIPYEETKGYVKLVMRNFIFYSRLSSRDESLAFPEWCLAGLQDIKP